MKSLKKDDEPKSITYIEGQESNKADIEIKVN